MGQFTRYSKLLIHVMSPDLREEFFGDDEEGTDDGWDLFETVHPEKVEVLMSILNPLLDDVISELKFRRDHNILIGKNDELGAARLQICHRASKLDW